MKQFLLFFTEYSNMSHFPAGLRLFLAVYMNKGVLYLQHFLQSYILYIAAAAFGADDIYHDRREDRICITQGVVEHYPPEHIKL